MRWQEGSTWRQGWLAAGLVILTGTALWDGRAGNVLADDARTTINELLRAAELTGQVTDRRRDNVEIDGQTYALDSETQILDDEGRPRELKDIKPGTEVRYHLRRGQIDLLIIVLPR